MFVNKYEYQDYVGGLFNFNVGVYLGVGFIFCWQYNLIVSWVYDMFVVGVVVYYKFGYVDFFLSNYVFVFMMIDLYVSWLLIKGVLFVVGVCNLFDCDLFFLNQVDIFQVGGWDLCYVNVVGCIYYVCGMYLF